MPDGEVSQRMYMDRAVSADKNVSNVWFGARTVKATELGVKADSVLRAVMTDGVHPRRPPVVCDVDGCHAEYL